MQIVYYFIDLDILNAWKLYRRHLKHHQETKFFQFRELLCHIAFWLLQAYKFLVREQKLPSNSNKNDGPHQLKSKKHPLRALLTADVRYNYIAHWLIETAQKMR